MGVLHNPGTICQNNQEFVGSNEVIPTFGVQRVDATSHVYGVQTRVKGRQGHET